MAERKKLVNPTISSTLQEQLEMANILAASGAVPMSLAGKPGAVFAAIQYGRELGLGPMESINNIAVVSGKCTLSSDLVAARAYAHKDFRGCKIVTLTGSECTIKVSRYFPATNKTEDFLTTFTIDDAKLAGIVKPGSNWEKYKKRMLFHRTRTFALRDAFPEALHGMRTTEELAPEMAAEQELAEIIADDRKLITAIENGDSASKLPAETIRAVPSKSAVATKTPTKRRIKEK